MCGGGFHGACGLPGIGRRDDSEIGQAVAARAMSSIEWLRGPEFAVTNPPGDCPTSLTLALV